MSEHVFRKVLPPGSVHLNSPVKTVNQGADSVLVTTRSGRKFTSRYVICSIPSPLYGEITWQPPLPIDKQLLVQRSYLGTYAKLILFYDKAWWLDDGWSGFCLSSEAPVSLVFDTCDGVYGSEDPKLKPRQHSLSCFVVAGNGNDWMKLSKRDREKAVKEQVGRMIGSPEKVNNTIEVLEYQWADKEFSWGAPCPVFSCGAFVAFGDAHKKHHGKVFFAGSELSDIWKGYMEGALHSGKEIGGEAVQALKSGKMSKHRGVGRAHL